jgi:hypothetical protein
MPTTGNIPSGALEDILLPGGVSIIKERTCANLYVGDMYLAGGFTQNLRLTTGLRAWILGITAPSTPILAGSGSGNIVGVSATGSSGLTADVIPYLSWWDDVSQETSPLSAAGPTLSLVANKIAFSNLPTSIPEDDFKIVGTTTASASTTITGSGTTFLDDVRVGDKIALSSVPGTFSLVTVVTNDTTLTVATALGDGSSQLISVRRQMRATHIRIWYSVDGGLPRVAEQRQVGCTAVTPAIETIGDLGEPFTEDFTRFPRCKYAVVYHDRLYMAGDEQNPNIIYCSLIGLPERMSTLSLKTKNGKDVVGLYVVKDELLVGTGFSHDRIQGYTEDDISIDTVEPELGLTCHFGVQIIHGNAFVPTQFGPYLCTGSSFFPLNGDIRTVWTKDYENRPQAYEDTFSFHDPVRHVYGFWLGEHPLIPQARSISTSTLTGTTFIFNTTALAGIGSAFTTELAEGQQISLGSDPTTFATILSITDDFNLTLDQPLGDGTEETILLRSDAMVTMNAYLILDYQKVLPVEGGGFAAPRLSWDTQVREDVFAALLSMPGARRADLFTGSCDGNLYRRNQESDVDDSGDVGLKRFVVVHGADGYEDVGGDFLHGKRFVNLEMYCMSEAQSFLAEMFPGDEYAYPSADDVAPLSGLYRGPVKSYLFGPGASSVAGVSVPTTFGDVPPGTYTGQYEPKMVWTRPLKGVSGRRLTLAIKAPKPSDLRYMGYSVYWTEGPAPRRINILQPE